MINAQVVHMSHLKEQIYLEIDEKITSLKEWGFRPADQSHIHETPPSFSWKPQANAISYDLQCTQHEIFEYIDYEATGIVYNVHRPPQIFTSGQWFWRFRFRVEKEAVSQWSQVRRFEIAHNAQELPLPSYEELLSRVPRSHPRLFIRSEQIPEFRKRIHTSQAKIYNKLLDASEKLVSYPPSTKEPTLYPNDIVKRSEAWLRIWWNNRLRVIETLNGAATLGFTWLLNQKKEYGCLARKLLLECADWDPNGATGYTYNAEAAFPYCYYFARTYTFIYDLLTENDRDICRNIMEIRGQEMYEDLCPRHFNYPYDSYSNRAWHFLGEIGIAFKDEIPDASEWIWFSANVFSNVYPVWSDEDGGWHEGLAYWASYMQRFTWWADIMRVALGINAFNKPYFSQAGYYPMYLQPPGTVGGGFGDSNAYRDSDENCDVLEIFANQAQNPYWRWYVDAHTKNKNNSKTKDSGIQTPLYIEFIRDTVSNVDARPPTDLPTSRCFKGVGQAVLNTDLTSAYKNIELLFKSSPFGSQSHGYDAQNSFILYAFGERLLINTGFRDGYGSEHHKHWVWQTKSTNSIGIDGIGQIPHSPLSKGEIIDFFTSSHFDYVSGEAVAAYGYLLDGFMRQILFIKPEAFVIYDTIITRRISDIDLYVYLRQSQTGIIPPIAFSSDGTRETRNIEWYLHAPVEMDIRNQHDIRIINGKSACRINFLLPNGLELSQTECYDPPPSSNDLVEFHMTAKTPSPLAHQTFITVLRPYLSNEFLRFDSQMQEVKRGYVVNIPLSEGYTEVFLPKLTSERLYTKKNKDDGELRIVKFDAQGKLVDRLSLGLDVGVQ